MKFITYYREEEDGIILPGCGSDYCFAPDQRLSVNKLIANIRSKVYPSPKDAKYFTIDVGSSLLTATPVTGKILVDPKDWQYKTIIDKEGNTKVIVNNK